MELHEIGQQLRETREKKGLSLHDVHDKLKLSVHVLEAMEKGEESNLPHPVYTRGFLQEYAKFLELDWEELTAALDHLYQPEQEMEEPVEIPSTLKMASKPSIFSLFLKGVGAILLLALVIGLVWFLITPFFAENPKDSVPEPEAKVAENATSGHSADTEDKELQAAFQGQNASEVPETTEEKDSKVSAEQTLDEGPAANSTGQGDDLKEVGVSKETEALDSNGSQAESTPSATLATSFSEDDASRLMQVTASGDCWVMAEQDGETREYYLRPGDKVKLSFDETLRLRLGNSGGVSLILDGREYPFDGEENEVRTITVGTEE
jgi:cytoskeleton protein RodZ